MNTYPVPPIPKWIDQAERLMWSLDGPDGSDRKWRHEIFKFIPKTFQLPLAEHYSALYKDQGRRRANLYLLRQSENLNKHRVKLAYSDDELIGFAKRQAKNCVLIAGRFASNHSEAFRQISGHIQKCGLTLPDVGKFSMAGIIKRACDEHWWRRRTRKILTREIEKYAIEIGLVSKFRGIYASDENVNRRIQQKRRNRRILESLIAINEAGQEYSLQELSDRSVSNPDLRRKELMCRIAGLEAVAKLLGHVGEFYTWTCPSCMHAIRSEDGEPNPKYDGTSPKAAHDYLNKLWQCIRAKLKRLGIEIYGLRVVEPHHDGTPHWHLLLFMEYRHADTVKKIMREYLLRKDPNEAGAQERRFKAEHIDWNKGTATGYIAKYIAKNIDGEGIATDLYGKDAKSSAQRTEVWASTWGIRQFQQIGGPSVTTWRELRRIHTEPVAFKEIWQAADDGDFCQFTQLMGGPTAKRKDHNIKLSKIWSDKLNRYGEPLGFITQGVEEGKIVLLTRTHQWEITQQNKRNCTTPINTGGCNTPPIPVLYPSSTDAMPLGLPPWSSVNNCTP